MFADDDGVVIAPAAQIEAALETAETIGAKERAILAAIGRGESLHDQTNYAEHVAALDAGREQRARLHDRCRRALTGRTLFARRQSARGGEELAAILAGVPARRARR